MPARDLQICTDHGSLHLFSHVVDAHEVSGFTDSVFAVRPDEAEGKPSLVVVVETAGDDAGRRKDPESRDN
jgi:hypothetical protein